MDKKTLAFIIGSGVGLASLLPIFRSGRKGGMNFWEFIYHHSVLSNDDALWIKDEELEVIEELAENGIEGVSTCSKCGEAAVKVGNGRWYCTGENQFTKVE